jgi:hypothetical protein
MSVYIRDSTFMTELKRFKGSRWRGDEPRVIIVTSEPQGHEEQQWTATAKAQHQPPARSGPVPFS